MTEEEYFIKNYPDFCYGDKPLSPHWDLFQYGVEFGERQSEKKIEELEGRLKEHESVGDAQFWENVWSWKTKAAQLTKAKEIIQQLIANAPNTYSGTNIELQQKKMFSFQDAVNKAEQFK